MTDEPYFIDGADRPSQWLVTCDHASNHVPHWINDGDLGLPRADMDRHIAYDVGAKGVALALGQALNAPVVGSNFSRLVIDPNRGADDPTLIMQLYDGTLIPANRGIDAAERAKRIETLYEPYHAAYAELAARRADTVILSVHSFTPQLQGKPIRPWEIGVLFAQDQRLTTPLIETLQSQTDYCVGINEPYRGYLPKDAIDRHALQHNRLNALIEIRNDLIVEESQQRAWAAQLAPILNEALAKTTLSQGS
ncbi:N-formylglutamate amidohydrolase [Algirhabdus cladophorae]|uniref:N-formylglutamate amidohydrolase n=1 Tax=Algirhabdus cladophorae TaxID=3377108 RepID=UPI003B84670F